MTSHGSRIFDDLSRLMNDAADVADGVRREAETAVRGQMERIVNELDLVKRDDYDALRDLVTIQGEEIEALRRELDAFKRRKKTTP
ncbi:accessory factor UbiK family protein [Pelagibacterium montanilacus]|uniref:accessory factor UbiK family protein n=1 Tax=Pelagibacterium montanilacus TaxID=2185280 RepID=UPI000F8D8D4D|nr:accessory factor UbiK family protein [Pelagibacterium montanilacus]